MIMVTGGAGFIGSSFVREIDNPIVFDALTYAGRLENLKDVKHIFIKGDIRNIQEIDKAVKENDVDTIVNFAAESHVDRSIVDPYIFLDTNIKGVVNLLEIARKYDLKIVHISTDEVYGEQENSTEDFPLKPSSPYSASKASGDMFIHAYIRTYGVNAIIIRPSNNYGPRQFPEKLIPKTIIRILKGMEIPVYGDGKQERDWIFVEDTAKIIKKITQDGKKGEIYNLPGGQRKTNIEIIEELGKILGKKPLIKYVKDRPGHDKLYSMKNTKIPYKVTPLEEGLRKTVDWYMNNEWWWSPLLGNEFFKSEVPW